MIRLRRESTASATDHLRRFTNPKGITYSCAREQVLPHSTHVPRNDGFSTAEASDLLGYQLGLYNSRKE